MKSRKYRNIVIIIQCLFLLTTAIPAFSGELAGHKFLITSVRTGETEIFLIDPDTGDATNLTRSPNSEEHYPCWSPDGRQITFTSNRDGTYNLYVTNADGSNVRQLTYEKDPTVAYMPSWSGDGKQIVFGLHGEQPWMAGISPNGKNFKILGKGHNPCISPDGKKIVYTNQVGQALEQFVCDADGKNVRQLTHLGKISCPAAWSPDGQWISFRLTDNAFWHNKELMKKTYEEKRGDKRPVWVMKADGSNPHIVEVLRYQCAIDGSRAAWKPAK